MLFRAPFKQGGWSVYWWPWLVRIWIQKDYTIVSSRVDVQPHLESMTNGWKFSCPLLKCRSGPIIVVNTPKHLNMKSYHAYMLWKKKRNKEINNGESVSLTRDADLRANSFKASRHQGLPGHGLRAFVNISVFKRAICTSGKLHALELYTCVDVWPEGLTEDCQPASLFIRKCTNLESCEFSLLILSFKQTVL